MRGIDAPPNFSIMFYHFSQARRARANLRRMLILFKAVSRRFLCHLLLPFFPPKQNKCLEEVTKHEEEVRVFHETYDAVVAEDKVCQHGKTAIKFALAHTHLIKCTKKI